MPPKARSSAAGAAQDGEERDGEGEVAGGIASVLGQLALLAGELRAATGTRAPVKEPVTDPTETVGILSEAHNWEKFSSADTRFPSLLTMSLKHAYAGDNTALVLIRVAAAIMADNPALALQRIADRLLFVKEVKDGSIGFGCALADALRDSEGSVREGESGLQRVSAAKKQAALMLTRQQDRGTKPPHAHPGRGGKGRGEGGRGGRGEGRPPE
jgi:hypothetical protein